MKMYLHVELDLIFFTYGDRFLNIIHTKLRHNCALNNDLFRCNIINSPLCSCGKLEDTYHYFFTCNKYKDATHIVLIPMSFIHLFQSQHHCTMVHRDYNNTICGIS